MMYANLTMMIWTSDHIGIQTYIHKHIYIYNDIFIKVVEIISGYALHISVLNPEIWRGAFLSKISSLMRGTMESLRVFENPHIPTGLSFDMTFGKASMPLHPLYLTYNCWFEIFFWQQMNSTRNLRFELNHYEGFLLDIFTCNKPKNVNRRSMRVIESIKGKRIKNNYMHMCAESENICIYYRWVSYIVLSTLLVRSVFCEEEYVFLVGVVFFWTKMNSFAWSLSLKL